MPEPPSTRLGLLSDTHGDAEITNAAVRLLTAAGATALIHLGDVGSEAVLEELVAFRAGPVHVVFGNCDDESTLERHAARLDLNVAHPAGVLRIGDRRIGFTHGHLLDLRDARAVEGLERLLTRLRVADAGAVDYLLHGHTHLIRDERFARGGTGVRIVNPGALHRAVVHSVAVLDPVADRLESLVVTRRWTTGATA